MVETFSSYKSWLNLLKSKNTDFQPERIVTPERDCLSRSVAHIFWVYAQHQKFWLACCCSHPFLWFALGKEQVVSAEMCISKCPTVEQNKTEDQWSILLFLKGAILLAVSSFGMNHSIVSIVWNWNFNDVLLRDSVYSFLLSRIKLEDWCPLVPVSWSSIWALIRDSIAYCSYNERLETAIFNRVKFFHFWQRPNSVTEYNWLQFN